MAWRLAGAQCGRDVRPLVLLHAPGGFTDHEIPLNDANRHAGLEALEIVDRAIELGFLPPAPAERACTWCEFRVVCGPHEAQRVTMKSADKLGDLESLREMP